MEFKWPRRSHRDVDTYFEGYEKQERTDPRTGRKRTEYVYRGDHYLFALPAEEYAAFRRGSALRGFGAAALFLAAHALGPRGSVLPWIGVPALLGLIPLIYFLLGLLVLLGTREPRMTVRQYCFGLERMENSLWVLLALWAVAAGGEVVYLLVKGLFTGPELLSAALQAGALALLFRQQRRQTILLGKCVHRPDRLEKKEKQNQK